jgi:cysteinyl-tRNA synthetase
MEGLKTLSNIQGTAKNNDSAINKELLDLVEDVYKHMNDDFNTPRAIASIFKIVTKINSLKSGKVSLANISQETLNTVQSKLKGIIFDVFGLMDDTAGGAGGEVLDGLMQLVIELRQEARESKNWGISDKIRDSLKELEIQIKDGKDGTTWSI